MIDLTLLSTGRHRDTPPGALFLPVVSGGERFLAGRVNDYPVLVVLEGERPFHLAPADRWSRSSGLFLIQGRFRVQLDSAIPIRSALDAPLGALVLSPLGIMVIGEDDNGKKGVLLAGGKGSTDIEDGDVGFANWQIVTGIGDELAIHFQHAGQS